MAGIMLPVQKFIGCLSVEDECWPFWGYMVDLVDARSECLHEKYVRGDWHPGFFRQSERSLEQRQHFVLFFILIFYCFVVCCCFFVLFFASCDAVTKIQLLKNKRNSINLKSLKISRSWVQSARVQIGITHKIMRGNVTGIHRSDRSNYYYYYFLTTV